MSVLVTARDLTKAFDSRSLFDKITFGLDSGERVGLIGPNGAGKSTLMQILAGKLEADSGDLVFQRGVKVAFLEQSPKFNSSATVMECILEGAQDPTEWTSTVRAEELMWKLGVEDAGVKPDAKIEVLSGGWKKRIAILRELMREPDLFLLDEPTNHLDIEGILWLENLLRSSRFASLVITHDRFFLQRVVSRILELDRRNPNGLLSVSGNYEKYLETKQSLMESQENREEILRGILRRETEWVRAGVKAQRSKQQARIDRHAELTNEVREISARNVSRTTEMEFQSLEANPKRLIETKRLSKSYAGKGLLFSNLDLFLGPGTRLGILGENGCGKSTLIRVLLREEKADSGHIHHSDQLKVAYFEQNRDKLDPKVSLMRTVCPYGDGVIYRGRSIHIRTYLDKFLFSQKQMDLPVGKLSGGEQSRVLLAKLMLLECNLLVLDEPTNDLDIPTLSVLQDCLVEFEGAVILVSHDRFFLDQVSTRILAFPLLPDERKVGRLHYFEDLNQWESWHAENLARRSPKVSVKSGAVKSSASGKDPSKPKTSPAELEKITRKIERLEKEYGDLEAECARPEIAADIAKLTKIGKEMQVLQDKIHELYKEWEKVEG